MNTEEFTKEIRGMIDMATTCEENGVVLDDTDSPTSFKVWMTGRVFEVTVTHIGVMDLPE